MRMIDKQIILNAVAWEDVAAKVDVEPLQQLCDGNIRLINYGDGVKQIVFTFIAVPSSDTFHENDASFDPKTGKVEVALRLSYEHMQNTSAKRCLQMMASLFIVSLDLYDGIDVLDFNIAAFRNDLQNLFEKEGFLVPVDKQ